MIVFVAVVVFIISFRPSSIYIIIINSLSLFNSIADFNNTQCREFRSICGGRHYTPVAAYLLYCRRQPLRVSVIYKIAYYIRRLCGAQYTTQQFNRFEQ